MLIDFSLALFCAGLYCDFRNYRAFRRIVDESRTDTSEQFWRFFGTEAWRQHRSLFPESGLRQQMVRDHVLSWLFWGGGYVLLVISILRGGRRP